MTLIVVLQSREDFKTLIPISVKKEASRNNRNNPRVWKGTKPHETEGTHKRLLKSFQKERRKKKKTVCA